MYECAAQGTRVCSLDVEYMGWNAYGCSVHRPAAGSYITWANPLAVLAVIRPDWPVVRSLISVTSPCGESWIDTSIWSPGLMNRSVDGLGVNEAAVRRSGRGAHAARRSW